MRSTFDGPRLAALREDQELTQAELAAKVTKHLKREHPLHYTTISKFETGARRPSPKIFGGICRVLGIAKDDLIAEAA
jgi:transcriptional regulator with XRE-family HTH domain